MKKIIYLTLFCTLVFTSCIKHRVQPPHAIKGILDLRGVDFAKHGAIKLDGEWEFYWKQLLKHGRGGSQTLPYRDYIHVPGKWNGHVVDSKAIGGQGYATYRLKILLPSGSEKLALKIPDQESAHEVWVNGKFVAKNGNVAADADRTQPFYLPLVRRVDRSQEVEILVQISSFHHQYGGFIKPLELGVADRLFAARKRNRLTEAALAGAILIMGLYHLGLFFYRRKDKSAFWFGLLCLTMTMRILVMGERLLIEVGPEDLWTIFIKLEYATLYAIPALFALFLRAVYPRELSRWAVRAVLSYVLPGIAAIIALPPRLFTHTLITFQFLVFVAMLYAVAALVRAVLHSERGARLILTGFLIFFIVGINDILYDQLLIGPGPLLPFGLFVFIFAQAGALAHRIAAAFNNSEELSEKLEQKVEERTQELHEAREAADNILHNILPEKIANELKEKGEVTPLMYDNISVLFTDFKGFTSTSSEMFPDELVERLNAYFHQYERICERHKIEKLKTIGDSFMCAGGLPEINFTHPLDICLAALEIREFTKSANEIVAMSGGNLWEIRIGIHAGPAIAGVIGAKKYSYDIWGDAVNVAARLEQTCEVGNINISTDLRELVEEYFVCIDRGEIAIKNHGEIQMYYLEKIKPEYSRDGEGVIPNKLFWEKHKNMEAGV